MIANEQVGAREILAEAEASRLAAAAELARPVGRVRAATWRYRYRAWAIARRVLRPRLAPLRDLVRGSAGAAGAGNNQTEGMTSERVQVHVDFEDQHWWFVGRRRILRRVIRQLLPPSSGHVVVDVGCGTGANIAALADEYRCYGFDLAPDALDAARARFPQVSFTCGLAPAAFSAIDAVPELIMLTDVIEHVKDDHGFLKALLDAVAPGTLFLVTVPAEPALWTMHDEAFGHYRRYEVETLRALWSGEAADELLMSHFNHHLYPAVRSVRWLNRLRGTTSGAADTDFSMPPGPVNHLLMDLFTSEAGTLCRALQDSGAPTWSTGVSLMAVLLKR